MKPLPFAVIVLAAFAAVPAADAQSRSCNASVSRRSVTESKTKEKTWDIVFDIAAPSCDASQGTFEYTVNVSTGGSEGSRAERIRQTESFETAEGKRTAVKVSFHARPGQEVVDVTGAQIRQCACQVNR